MGNLRNTTSWTGRQVFSAYQVSQLVNSWILLYFMSFLTITVQLGTLTSPIHQWRKSCGTCASIEIRIWNRGIFAYLDWCVRHAEILRTEGSSGEPGREAPSGVG